MSEVFIVAEQVDSHVSKPALELLTLARRLGEPVAVVFGETDETVAKTLAEYGATRVLFVADPALTDYLVAPKVEALAQIAANVDAAAILISSTPEGREIGGRLAVKLESGLITDAIDIASNGTTTQSVFAGNWTVTAAVTHGVPVITVKPNAVTPEAAPTEPAVEQVEVTISDTAVKWPSGADRGGGRRLRRTRHRWRLCCHRGVGRPARWRGRCLTCRGRRRLVSVRIPDRPDRQDRLAAALHRGRHLRCHPAPSRNADVQGHCRREQGC